MRTLFSFFSPGRFACLPLLVPFLALVGPRTGAAQVALPSSDAATRAQSQEAIRSWLAQPLTQDAAVRIALLNNPGLQAQLAALGIADAQRVQALTLPNPHLMLGRLTSGAEREIERTLEVSLLDPITLPWRTQWQNQQMEQATLAAAQQVLMLAADTRRAWLRAVAAEQVAGAHERMHDAADMGAMEMPLPDNTHPMMTGTGPFGPLEMGGMFTTLKVRADLAASDWRDPGHFKHPPGTQAHEWQGEAATTPRPARTEMPGTAPGAATVRKPGAGGHAH